MESIKEQYLTQKFPEPAELQAKKKRKKKNKKGIKVEVSETDEEGDRIVRDFEQSLK